VLEKFVRKICLEKCSLDQKYEIASNCCQTDRKVKSIINLIICVINTMQYVFNVIWKNKLMESTNYEVY